MTEGTVSWNDYCPRCKKSTPRNFGFGKIRMCDDCEKEADRIRYQSLSAKELWEIEYNTKLEE